MPLFIIPSRFSCSSVPVLALRFFLFLPLDKSIFFRLFSKHATHRGDVARTVRALTLSEVGMADSSPERRFSRIDRLPRMCLILPLN